MDIYYLVCCRGHKGSLRLNLTHQRDNKMYQNETTSFLQDCARATIRLNDQTQAAIVLQECADEGKYGSVEDLAKHAAYLGASYKVLAWVDSYCLTRNRYNNNQ